MIVIFVKMIDYMWNPNTSVYECIKACKVDEYLNIKNCLYKKHLFGKLALACEEKLNTTKT